MAKFIVLLSTASFVMLYYNYIVLEEHLAT